MIRPHAPKPKVNGGNESIRRYNQSAEYHLGWSCQVALRSTHLILLNCIHSTPQLLVRNVGRCVVLNELVVEQLIQMFQVLLDQRFRHASPGTCSDVMWMWAMLPLNNPLKLKSGKKYMVSLKKQRWNKIFWAFKQTVKIMLLRPRTGT